MNETVLAKYKKFRALCLKNAEDALRSAQTLVDKNLNHIAYHLTVLSLEEIGKVFVGWYALNNKEEWGKETFKIPIDDHIKKLFWAVWGSSFGKQKMTSKEIDEIKSFASTLHDKRLDVLYTALDDTIHGNAKITNEELSLLHKTG